MRFLAPLAVLVAIVEIYVIIRVGQLIGVMPTIGLLILGSAVGSLVVKRGGRRAWRALGDARAGGSLAGGSLQTRELADAAIILVGGVLLILPGFVTDVVGLFLVLPFTLPVSRRAFGAIMSRRVVRYGVAGYSSERGGVHQIYHDDPGGP